MSEKNLPIKLVLQRASDTHNNQGGGSDKFFGDMTQELQDTIVKKFSDILDFYATVFQENKLVPAIGKITVKPEAIAKSHKPSDLCKRCRIIGGGELRDIYIKVTKESIHETIALVKNPPTKKFKANLTAISDIQPIRGAEKIACELTEISAQGMLDKVKSKIKIKLFDFNDDFDNEQIQNYIMKKLSSMNLSASPEIITYGEKIKYIKVQVESYNDIIAISNINGIKSVDFFQEYSLPLSEAEFESSKTDLESLLEDNYQNSDIRIGIIDGGISNENPYLEPYVVAREIHVGADYQNPTHATFIASTIQYGNKLNGISTSVAQHFKFVDIVAIPNGDPKFGPIDSIGEESLMEIIEETMEKYSESTKIWNMSLGIESKVCGNTMSDLGVFLDYIQDTYNVQIFVSSGNISTPPLREWPAQIDMKERDRIISPADSVRAISVGSIALFESDEAIVKSNEPSPFSRRGPGANNIVKPDVVDYGGNIAKNLNITNLGMKGLDRYGHINEGIGTSYATPRVAQKFAAIYDDMVQKDMLLTKAMLIHSARMNSRSIIDQHPDNIKYYGFGMPSIVTQDILQCSKEEITLVFRQKIVQGSHLEMYDFPYPTSLVRDGKCYGEIGMTLAYNPILDDQYGEEYCRSNIDASFGMYHYDSSSKLVYKGCVPLEATWDEKFEKYRVEHGFKWSPIKSYYRKISDEGIKAGEGWKIRIDMVPRIGASVIAQEFVLIITIRDPLGHDIYSEVVKGLKERNYLTNNLETRQQVRQR